MLVAPSTARLPRPLTRPCVAIGNFDGVHRGHQALLAAARADATRLAGEVVVLTFDPHPTRIVRPSAAPALLTTLAGRLALLASTGVVAATVVEPFDEALAKMAPTAFIEQLLVRNLGVAAVLVGSDFRFGEGRRGDATLLTALGAEHGFAVTVVDKLSVDGEICSSSTIRAHVAAGDVARAATLLGRTYEVEGTVGHGAERGRQIGFPTANIDGIATLVPAEGVYAGYACTTDDGPAIRRIAAINIGRNPTFVDAGARTVEAYLLDFDGDLYDRRLRLGLVARLRPELKFDSVDALVRRMHEDVSQTRTLVKGPPP